tara:strand:+ start:9064 stop:9252 length:189 start_codon:yes stop_codon:yes gene_type:complete
MDTRDLWEEQVSRLTNKYGLLLEKIEDMDARMEYVENLVLTLLVGLKNSGVLVPAEEDSPEE